MVPLSINLTVLLTSLVDKLKRIGLIGSLIFIGSTTGFMMGISWVGVQYPWSSWHIVILSPLVSLVSSGFSF
jgi:hypothetical protein